MDETWLLDIESRAVRLTGERRRHIFEHAEMIGLEATLEETLRRPDAVVQSVSDPTVRLYYRPYARAPGGAKLLCVVVKLTDADAFVITAYITDRIKKGRPIWSST